jgi:phage baseplate assembly protein V
MALGIKDFKRLIAPLQKKIFLLLGRGIIKAVNNSDGTQKIQVVVLNGETITDLERFQNYGFESYPLTDSQAAILFMNGNRDNGIAVVAHDRRYRPKNLAEGDASMYTSEDSGGSHRIHLKKADKSIDVKGDKINRTGANEINDLSNTVNITGTAQVNAVAPTVQLGSITPAELFALIDSRALAIINAHVHSGVTVGGGSTGIPTTQLVLGTHTTVNTKAK